MYEGADAAPHDGETTVRTQHGHKVPKLAPFYTAIRAYVAERGDTTIAELRTWLLATHQVAASVGLIGTRKVLGLSLKKRMARPVCKDDFTGRVGLHQRIRSQGLIPGQDGMRAPRA